MLLAKDVRRGAVLRLAEAQRDDVAQVVADGIARGVDQAGVCFALGLDKNDRRSRRDRVSPLDVDRNLLGPTQMFGVGGGEIGDPVRLEGGEAGGGRDAPAAVESR